MTAITITFASPRRRPKTGDRRVTKAHGLQIRVLVRDSHGRYVVSRDRAFIESKRYLATHELIERLRAELAQAREVLRSVEWTEMPAYYGTVTRCPLCGDLESEGHAPDCALSAALAAKGE